MAKTSYVLAKRIARGGMAEIYLGKAVGQDAFQRIVAIKRILPHYAQDKEFVEMFRDEAHICKRLTHANIVQVFDFTEVEKSFALIMEHIDGADLRTLLSSCETARIRLSVPMAIFIVASSARGLHYAHVKVDDITRDPLGIVHRDISPQNILISYEGEVKITDFGIASADDKMTETRPGVVKGKYSYMSPEQVGAKSLDGRSDIFSLSIVLWEALAMKRLFAGQTEVETIRKVQNCEIPLKLVDLNPDVDEPLMKIVHMGLAKDRKHRFQTAAEFEKVLLKYLHSRYPDFVSSELGNFLKQILANKRNTTQKEIKDALTGTTQRSDSDLDLIKSGSDKDEDGRRTESNTSGNEIKFRVNKNGKKNGVRDHKRPQTARPKTQMTASVQYHRHPMVFPKSMPFKKRSHYISVAILAFVLTFLYIIGDLVFDQKMHLELRTIPDVISLQINGKKLKKGIYIKTPIKLNLAPNKYQLTLTRPGYHPEIIDFQGAAGDYLKTDVIKLKKLPGRKFVAVKFISPGKKTYVNISNGLYKGNPPLVANLLYGETHAITVAFHHRGKKKLSRCSFNTENIPRKLLNIIIRIESGRLICDKN